MKRSSFLSIAAAAAVATALCLAGPGFAKGGGGSGSGGGSSGGAKGGSSTGGSNTKTPPAKAKTVYDVIEADTSLSKFKDALKATGLDATLKGTSGTFTVLAPSDTAFGKVDAAKLADLAKPENKAKYKAIIEGHILTSKMKADDIGKATKLSASGGASHEVKLDTDKKTALIDGTAKITKADIEGSNGLIQIIDTVLIPAEKPAEKPAPAPGGGK